MEAAAAAVRRRMRTSSSTRMISIAMWRMRMRKSRAAGDGGGGDDDACIDAMASFASESRGGRSLYRASSYNIAVALRPSTRIGSSGPSCIWSFKADGGPA